VAIGGASALAGLGVLAGYEGERLARDERPRLRPAASPRATLQRRHFPNVPVVTHDGRTLRFYDDLVKDRKVVLTFVSSRARAESEQVTKNLAALQRLFGARVGRDIFLYSIARTPERDSPAALRALASRSGAGPGWKFLTGRTSELEHLRRSLGFSSEDPAEDADPRFGVGIVRYGIEPEMRWAQCQSQASARMLAHSMLLDFGAGPADAGSPIARTFATGANDRGAPIWECHLLLDQVA
jgi:protein SCO1/2